MSNSKITDRIAKLLKLAGGTPDANEAANAYANAQRLATRHALNLEDIESGLTESEAADSLPPIEGIERRVIESWDKAIAWKVSLAIAIAGANACKVYLRRGSEGYIKAYGQPRDLDRVEYLYQAIAADVDRLARRAVADWDGPKSRTYGRDFRIGCAHAISSRLPSADSVIAEARLEVEEARGLACGRDDMAALGSATMALVRVDQAVVYQASVAAAVDAFETKLKLKKGAGFSGPRRASGYFDGRRAGRSVALARGKALGK